MFAVCIFYLFLLHSSIYIRNLFMSPGKRLSHPPYFKLFSCMIVPLQELIITFPLLIVTVILFFITGAVFQFFFGPGRKRSELFSLSHETVFWNSLFGFLLLTSCYAITITKFQSCLLPIPFLLIALARYGRRPGKEIKAVAEKNQNAGNRKQILFFSLVAICIYWLFYLFGFISFDPSTIKYIGNDTNFYGRVAHHLNYTGIENTSLD